MDLSVKESTVTVRVQARNDSVLGWQRVGGGMHSPRKVQTGHPYILTARGMCEWK